MPLNIIILGAGIAGNAAAIALTKLLPQKPSITILEKRAEPGTIGGAVNLTPNALRCLDHLGVLSIINKNKYGCTVDEITILDSDSGIHVAAMDFKGPTGTGIGKQPHKGLRIRRCDLLNALLEAVSAYPNISVKYSSDTTAITEHATTGIHLTLADGSQLSADLLLGCDGIHSAARRLLVEPTRRTSYTGVAVAQGFTSVSANERAALPLKDTALLSGQQGTLLLSYFQPSREEIYLAAVMETPDAPTGSAGWRARGEDKQAVKATMATRCRSKFPAANSLLDTCPDWFLYPVNTLQPDGKWSSVHGRAVLLGDAAHAMPPQGESTGIAMEDAVFYARFLAHVAAVHEDEDWAGVLAETSAAYDAFRRPTIRDAYNTAFRRWKNVMGTGWLMHKLNNLLAPWFLWWTEAARQKTFEEDIWTVDLKL